MPADISQNTPAQRSDPVIAKDRDDLVVPVERAVSARGDMSVISDVIPYLRPYVGRIVIAMLLIIAAKLTNLAVPFALKGIRLV